MPDCDGPFADLRFCGSLDSIDLSSRSGAFRLPNLRALSHLILNETELSEVSLPSLVDTQSVFIERNPTLTRVDLSSLEDGFTLSVVGNPTLSELRLPANFPFEGCLISSNPQLCDSTLPQTCSLFSNGSC